MGFGEEKLRELVTLGETMACAAAHMAETTGPSTPKCEKKACMFLVSRKGTGSANSTVPFASYAAQTKEIFMMIQGVRQGRGRLRD